MKGSPKRKDIMTDVVDDILAHYGVKGMRWGVRKSRRSSGKARKTPSPSAPAKKPGKVRSAVTKLRTPKRDFKMEAKNMSDEDLRKILNRMDMEKKYATMMNELTNPKKEKSAVHKMAEDAIKEVLKDQGKKFLNAAITKGINSAAKKRGR